MTSEATAITPQTVNDGPSLSKFLFENCRLPFVTDEVKPWEYRGWLVPYIQLAESVPGIAPRYDYVARTLEAGKLLDEPLPQIKFIGETDPAARPGMKQLEEMMKIVGYRSSSWNAFRDIAVWLAYALGVSGDRSSLDAELQEKLYRLFNLEPWLLNPTDYLGQHLCEVNHGKGSGFFPTPMHICTMAARMTFPNGEDSRAKKTMDPCVGTGRFLLAASNYSMRLYGQDIDGLVLLCTKINLALYAPWYHIPEAFYAEHDASQPTCEASRQVNVAPAGRDSQESGNKRTALTPENGEKKVYTTEIEQPTLFSLK